MASAGYRWCVLGLMMTGFWAAGCADRSAVYTTERRMSRGLVLVLPGIEGEGPFSDALRSGLNDANIRHGIRVYRWGRPVPLVSLLLNQVDFVGNRLVARKIADVIVKYQDQHPGRPVHLVGHSGGGGIAVFTLEQLPEGRQVDGVVLLNASISSTYDLGDALRHARKGIVNFSSLSDVGLLIIGTTVVGNVDGGHGPAAGAIGFSKKDTPVGPHGRLYEVPWNGSMAASGHIGDHMGSVQRSFVAKWVAPWVLAENWDEPGLQAAK